MSETTPPPSDTVDSEDLSGIPIAVVTTGLTIATTCVCLRTYTRAVILRQFGPDDWAAIVAMIFAAGSGITVATSTCLLPPSAFLHPPIRLLSLCCPDEHVNSHYPPDTLNGHGRHIKALDPSRLWIYFRVRVTQA